MSVRKLALLVGLVCAASLLVPTAAGASTSRAITSFKNIPIAGHTHGGKQFTGHFTVTRFVTRGGKSYALGNLSGKLGNTFVKRSNVRIPIKVQQPGQAGAAATCPILHLVLGPLDLNLLGLQVHLNQVVLDITAHSGPGNLLGNLLCAVAHLLDNTSPTLTQLLNLANLLNRIIGILT